MSIEASPVAPAPRALHSVTGPRGWPLVGVAPQVRPDEEVALLGGAGAFPPLVALLRCLLGGGLPWRRHLDGPARLARRSIGGHGGILRRA